MLNPTHYDKRLYAFYTVYHNVVQRVKVCLEVFIKDGRCIMHHHVLSVENPAEHGLWVGGVMLADRHGGMGTLSSLGSSSSRLAVTAGIATGAQQPVLS